MIFLLTLFGLSNINPSLTQLQQLVVHAMIHFSILLFVNYLTSMKITTINQRLGIAIKLIREGRNYSQDHIANSAGYANRSTYAKIEAGQIEHICMVKLSAICHALKCNISHLFLIVDLQQPEKNIKTWQEFNSSLMLLPDVDKKRMNELVAIIFDIKTDQL